MSIATDVVNKTFGGYQEMATSFFENFMDNQLKNMAHIRGPYLSYFDIFPDLTDATRPSALESFVLRTFILSSQGSDCTPGNVFGQRMDYITTNLGVENAIAVLLHCYHLASLGGHMANAQLIKARLRTLFEENPDQAINIGTAPMTFNRYLVHPSFVEQLEKTRFEKMHQHSTNWSQIILGLGATILTAYSLNKYFTNKSYFEQGKLLGEESCKMELVKVKNNLTNCQNDVDNGNFFATTDCIENNQNLVAAALTQKEFECQDRLNQCSNVQTLACETLVNKTRDNGIKLVEKARREANNQWTTDKTNLQNQINSLNQDIAARDKKIENYLWNITHTNDLFRICNNSLKESQGNYTNLEKKLKIADEAVLNSASAATNAHHIIDGTIEKIHGQGGK